MIKYLLPGSAATNTGVLGSETLRSTALLFAVFVTFASWPIATTLAIALRPTSRGRSSWANDPLVGGRDNFTWEMQPYRTQ